MIDADIRVEDDRWAQGRDLNAVVAACLTATAAEIETARENAELAILFTDDSAQRDLNKTYRGKDASTNVLSFPFGDTPLPANMPRPIGDISLAYETIMREAEDADIPPDAHLHHLIIHGLLHLLGYDHEDDAMASIMERMETRVLERLGIADPYRLKQV